MKDESEKKQDVFSEILLFLQYSVAEQEQSRAREYLESCRNSPAHLTLCKHYYRSLPEAREEPLLGMVVVDVCQGHYLLGVETTSHQYLYCTDFDQAIYLGEFNAPEGDRDIWLFFGYSSGNDFRKKCKDFSQYPVFSPEQDRDVSHCLICLAKEGDEHEFGCPVEICPWCEGQLNRCECRFEKLGVDEITTDLELDSLLELLSQKGRIPFTKGEGVSYPVAGDDRLDDD